MRCQALESFVLRCPKEISEFLDAILATVRKYIEYDPNYTYEEYVAVALMHTRRHDADASVVVVALASAMEDSGDESDEYGEYDDGGDFDDDTDSNWKVRAWSPCLCRHTGV